MSQIFKPEASTPPPPGFVEFLEGTTGGPVGPNGADTIFLEAATVANDGIPIEIVGDPGTNTLTTTVQLTKGAASSSVINAGLASFNSTEFTVDANGYVSFVSSAVVQTLTASTGTNPVPPNAGDTIFIGTALVSARSVPITTVGISAGNTVDIQVQISTTSATSVLNNVGLASFNSADFTIDSFGFVSLSGAIATTYTENTGTATPALGNLNLLATVAAAGTTPFTSTGTGSTVTYTIQTSQAAVASAADHADISSFNSAQFTVDANGFVSLSGTGAAETITGNSGGALSPTAGNWNILGTSVAAGTTPVTTAGAVSTLTVEVQTAQAIAATNATNIGLAAFNSAEFTVDANGFVASKAITVSAGAGISVTGSPVNLGGTVTIANTNGNPVVSFTVDANTGPGTNPVLPTAAGIVTITGGQVAAGTTTNVIRTDSLAANTYTIQVQRSQAAAASTVGDNGVSHFNSAFFTVDANGFVSLAGTGAGQTITGQSGGALSPTAGNWNIFGDGVTGSGTSTAGNIITNGTGSTLTISPTEAQFMTNYTQVLVGASPYTALATDYYISVVSSGGAITIKLPNAPTTNRLFIIKDNAGDASVNNISVTTVGGAVTIDGQTTYTLAGNYSSISLLFNGTSYEIF